jgi:uncharacterized hydrophobic protein (TIGR00271 family)
MMTDTKAGSFSTFRLQITEPQRIAVRESVSSGAALTGAYLMMNAAATLIAGFGLLENSPAVIIGAMLIAMLFGPIVGVALGLAEANISLLGRSLLSEIAGAGWVLAIGYGIGMSTRELSIGSEILSRTSPSILDLLIGLVGGLAGGFTFVSNGLSGVMVGVAIATALVPPLTTCGILLARQLPTPAGGAFLLFLSNFTAIAIGAMIVFLLAGYRPPAAEKAHKVLVPRLVSLVLLVLLGAHLTTTLRDTIAQSALQTDIRKVLSREVDKIPGARLIQLTLVPQQNTTNAWAVVRTPLRLSPEQVASLNEFVNRVAGRNIDLTVRSVITAETTRYGNVYETHFLPDEEPKSQ